jgi:hypothetical protein
MSSHPLSNPLTALDAAVAEIEAADAHLLQVTDEAKRRLNTAVAALGASVLSLAADERVPAERDTLARRLYWDYRRIPVRDIVVALGFANQTEMLDAAGTRDAGVPCADCGRPLLARTRTQLDGIRPATRRPSYVRGGASCDECQRLRQAAEEARWEREERRHRERMFGPAWDPGEVDDEPEQPLRLVGDTP